MSGEEGEEPGRLIASLALSGRFVLLNPKLGLWAFTGRTSDYVIVEELYCSCPRFSRSIERRECAHMRALKIAKESGRFKVVEAGDEDVSYIVWECLTLGHSPRLRALLYKS